jgi:adenosylhomocysteine nucleosidase
MKIGIVVAMVEEFNGLSTLFSPNTLIQEKPYAIYKTQYKNLEVYGIVSKIGKAAAASSTTLLLSQYGCDVIINLGSCGGINSANVSSIIMANTAGYYDVDVSAFGYKKGQMAQQPEFFKSSSHKINFDKILENVSKKYPIMCGTVITGDSFVSDKAKVEEIKHIYPNSLAVEMEGASVAQICNHFDKDFIFIKKVSDMADTEAGKSFKEEIQKMAETTPQVLLAVLDGIANS